MRGVRVPQHEETVRRTDEDVVTEHRAAQAAEAPRGDVEEEGPALVVVCLVEQDPLPWAETEVGDRGVRRWLGDGRAPGGADGPHGHVLVDAAGGEDAVGDVLDKVRLKRRPLGRDGWIIRPPLLAAAAALLLHGRATDAVVLDKHLADSHRVANA
uniref:Uncharacterized protein n=1 Tax=Triticum urartu TaxID=4572 RepID=A0A8R7U2I6_TRIUA